jgi:hypothetical protein
MRVALLAFLVFAFGNAFADQGTLEVAFTTKPAAGAAPPTIEATVIGAPNQPMEAFTLLDNSAKPAVALKPSKMLGSRQGHEPIAFAVVMSGWELWIGNDKEVPAITQDDPSRYSGILLMLRAAFDKADFKNAGPTNSVAMLVTYDDKAKIRVPMSPLSQFTGAKLGTQKDYFGTTGVELVQGITLALAELKKRQEPRKVLIVIGDGTDTNNETARFQLAKLKKQAAQDGVRTFAIVYKAKLSDEANLMPVMIPNTVVVSAATQVETVVADIVARTDDRKYLTFPGYDAKTRKGLAWDGKGHDLVITTAKHASTPMRVTLPTWKSP